MLKSRVRQQPEDIEGDATIQQDVDDEGTKKLSRNRHESAPMSILSYPTSSFPKEGIPLAPEDIETIFTPSPEGVPMEEVLSSPDKLIIKELVGTIDVVSTRKEELDSLVAKIHDLIAEVRKMKQSGIVMETDEKARSLTSKLQTVLQKFLRLKYGENINTFKVEMKLQFPSSMPDYDTAGESGVIIIETGPIDLVPYSVFYFLDIVEHFKGGNFHRNAGHVLQAQVRTGGRFPSLAFQEYNPGFPHKRLTLGYAGRPGGPEFYISTVDNTDNHGPGSQGSNTEADGCFGKVLQGEAVVKRMQKQPGKAGPNGFIDKAENYIKIVSLKLIDQELIQSS
eukprot:gene3208-6337_t